MLKTILNSEIFQQNIGMNMWLTENQVQKRNLKGTNRPCEMPDPDGLDLRVTALRSVIAKMLFLIFKDSLLSAIETNDWHRTNVVLIYKKGFQCIPVNYRPVRLTSIVSGIVSVTGANK